MNKKELLSFEEMYRMLNVFGELGISKLRITGGEPFVRTGIMEFLHQVKQIKQINQVHITTNGTFTKDKIGELEELGIKSINLSLDSLNKKRFHEITRRDVFDDVMSTFHALLDSRITTKINMVVMEGKNIEDIYPMIELSRDHDVAVRFIEEMPFNGTEGQGNATFWPMNQILDYVGKEFNFEKIPDPPSSTAYNYQIKGFKGSFGIIPAFTRTFCGTCNRLRITPQGDLRTCLYGKESTNLRDNIRATTNDLELKKAIQNAVNNRALDGFEAEKRRSEKSISESMATIGG